MSGHSCYSSVYGHFWLWRFVIIFALLLACAGFRRLCTPQGCTNVLNPLGFSVLSVCSWFFHWSGRYRAGQDTKPCFTFFLCILQCSYYFFMYTQHIHTLLSSNHLARQRTPSLAHTMRLFPNPFQSVHPINCRIGSLERHHGQVPRTGNINCRIGSLETKRFMLCAPQTINCRIGSLETQPLQNCKAVRINCRIGSLENQLSSSLSNVDINCRIGSLEIQKSSKAAELTINCRIGSLEIAKREAGSVKRINCRIGSLENLNNINMAFIAINCRIGSLERKGY